MSLTFFNPNSVFGHGFGGFDNEFFNTEPFTSTLTTHSPRYEVTQYEKQFRLAVDVPGVKPDHLTLELEQNGQVLHLSGDRKTTKKTDTSFEESEFKFDKRFTLGKNLDTTKMTAHLADGVLTLTAPKLDKLPPTTSAITVIEGEAPPLLKDKKDTVMDDDTKPHAQ